MNDIRFEDKVAIVTGAGHYARAEMVMTPGVRFPYDADVSPEDIAGSWGKITDLTGAEPVTALADYSIRVLAPAVAAAQAASKKGDEP